MRVSPLRFAVDIRVLPRLEAVNEDFLHFLGWGGGGESGDDIKVFTIKPSFSGV